jgi:lysophospholipase L1-like esterase
VSLKPTTYIAIGDSLGFGYKEATFNANFPTEPASAFEKGYVGDFAQKLAMVEKRVGNGLGTDNLGCPGETSGGMIGNGPLGSFLEATRASKSEPALHVGPSCAYHNLAGFELKFPYGSASQLEAAVGILESGATVKAVTINMGANDELETVGKCKNPAYDAEQGFGSFTTCLLTEASLAGHEYPGGLFTHIITNIGTTVGVLRSKGYTGQVVVLGIYNPQAFALPGSDGLQTEFNKALGKAITEGKMGPGVSFADVFTKINYNPAKPQTQKKEKQNLEKYTEFFNPAIVAFNNNRQKEKGEPETNEGDIHATELGYQRMAQVAFKAF